MTKIKIAAFFAALVFILTSCTTLYPFESDTSLNPSPSHSIRDTFGTDEAEDSPTSDTVVAEVVPEDELFTSRDLEGDYNKSKSILISLSGDSAFTTNSTSAVLISGSTVTIAAEGTYILRGSLDGMIIVDVDKTEKVQLVLDGVSIASATSAAIYVREADKVFITLTEGSENSLSSGDGFKAIDEYNIDSTVFSRADLTINGSGKLSVVSPAGHGIVCKDDIAITGGVITVNSASHGIQANDSVRFTGASLAIDCGKDGIHAKNNDDASLGFICVLGGSISVESEGDGISAGTYASISGGTPTVTGASGMAQTFSSSENQGVIAVSVGSQAAGTRITLTDSTGNIVIDHSPELSFAVVILSSPDIKKGETYTITVGEASGEFTAQ